MAFQDTNDNYEISKVLRFNCLFTGIFFLRHLTINRHLKLRTLRQEK